MHATPASHQWTQSPVTGDLLNAHCAQGALRVGNSSKEAPQGSPPVLLTPPVTPCSTHSFPTLRLRWELNFPYTPPPLRVPPGCPCRASRTPPRANAQQQQSISRCCRRRSDLPGHQAPPATAEAHHHARRMQQGMPGPASQGGNRSAKLGQTQSVNEPVLEGCGCAATWAEARGRGNGDSPKHVAGETRWNPRAGRTRG